MNQLNGEEIKNKKCLNCKIVTLEHSFCDTCFLNGQYGRCLDCKQKNTGKDWCQPCNSKRFQQNFDNWTSGNNDIDKLIQNTQLSAKNYHQILEWIPYNKFGKLKYIAEGGFGKVYKASWKDGHITHWDASYHKWGRVRDSDSFVALKSLNDSQNVTFEFINEITSHLKVHDPKKSDCIIRCHGITQDPNTKDYIMVMIYAGRGNLQNSLNIEKKRLHKKQKRYNFSNLDLNLQLWKYKINILTHISAGLKIIHEKGIIHRDLHVSNIVCSHHTPHITDMGLCKPANYNGENNMIYGVLPYLAPEILRGRNYTQASDIYSLGIIIYVVISELPPFYNIAHDEYLALDICKGLRPEFNTEVSELILHQIKRCLDADPLNRPTAKELTNILFEWSKEFKQYYDSSIENQEELIKSEIIKQIEETEQINNSSSISNLSPLTNKIHPKAIYKSRPFNFSNLPEPKNSDNYYEIYDNISTMKSSEKFIKSNSSGCLECAIIN